jgi:hypothetical protein
MSCDDDIENDSDDQSHAAGESRRDDEVSSTDSGMRFRRDNPHLVDDRTRSADTDARLRGDSLRVVGDETRSRDGRFRPGFCGNWRGRPRGAVGLKAKLKKELQKKTTVKMPGGKAARMAKSDVIITQLVERAMRDVKIAALIWRWLADEPSEAAADAPASSGADLGVPKLNRETLRRILDRARRLEEDQPDEE